MGINVVLWNYRGYGRSRGRPTIDRLKRDGENIVNYIRTQKLNIRVLGVHGESIGGCIAVHLAKECVLDFLVADRTFASIKAVALFRYGRLAYWASCLARIEDFEYTGEYLASNCPKAIICDPADLIVSDLASLKAGVAVRLLSHDVVNVVELAYLSPYLQSGFNHIISYAASTSCVTSLSRLQSYVEYLKSGSEDLIVHQYSALSLDTEEIPNDHLAASTDKMLTSLSSLEAGGSTLLDITRSPQGHLALMIWLMVLDIWGSCCKVGDEQLSNHMKSVEAIRACLQDIQSIQDEFEKSKNRVVQEVMKDVNTVFNVLIEILGYMEERCGLSSNLEISIDRMINEFQGAGQLIPVSCGHCGSLSQVEKYQLTRFLLSSLK